MKKLYLATIACCLLLILGNSLYAQSTKHVLVFSKTAGYRHESIPKGVATVVKILTDNKITTEHTENAELFHPDSLKRFDGVIFLNTSGTLFNEQQKQAFESFIRAGNGYLGIHAASDTEFDWPWYGQLVGGYFTKHPEIQPARIDVVNHKHPSTKHLPKVWEHKDEWYEFRNLGNDLNVLLNLDESSYSGGEMGEYHPIAWYHEFGGGRSFYTALGHTKESYDSELFQKHILGGVKYILKIDK